MEPVMVDNSYGKSQVCVTKVARGDSEHDVLQFTANVELRGDLAASYTDGDNRNVVATDTIRNTVYGIASDAPIASIEEFGLRLTEHFLKQYAHLNEAQVEIVQEIWDRIPSGAYTTYPTSFTHRGDEKRATIVKRLRGKEPTVVSSIRGLQVLKTSGSSWANFHRDEYRTLPDSYDRILSTVVDLKWVFNTTACDFNQVYGNIRDSILGSFAGHNSLGMQQTCHVMLMGAMRRCLEIEKISATLPNRHHVPYNLAAIGRKNKNEVFVATLRPYGLITEAVGRARSKL